jgi:sensor c-di-GMP phosphodiesterase-like protein
MWIVAIAAGALLAGLPILLVERVTNAYVERNAKSQLDSIAHGVLGNTVARLYRASTLLVDLSKANIADCSVASVDIMRRALYGAAPVREIAILEDGNRVLCSSSGTVSDQRVVLRESNMPGRQFALAIVSFRDQEERAMRLRLELPGARSIAALIPVGALLSGAIPSERHGSRRVRLFLDDGQPSAQAQIAAQERL